MVLHQAFRARCVRKNGIGGEVRHGVASGVSCEISKTWHVTPHPHREWQHRAFCCETPCAHSDTQLCKLRCSASPPRKLVVTDSHTALCCEKRGTHSDMWTMQGKLRQPFKSLVRPIHLVRLQVVGIPGSRNSRASLRPREIHPSKIRSCPVLPSSSLLRLCHHLCNPNLCWQFCDTRVQSFSECIPLCRCVEAPHALSRLYENRGCLVFCACIRKTITTHVSWQIVCFAQTLVCRGKNADKQVADVRRFLVTELCKPQWEERLYTPPPPISDVWDCDCTQIETKASAHHPLWVVVVYRIGLPI